MEVKERNKKIFEMRDLKHMCYKDISKYVGISPTRCRQIWKEKEKEREFLKKLKVYSPFILYMYLKCDRNIGIRLYRNYIYDVNRFIDMSDEDIFKLLSYLPKVKWDKAIEYRDKLKNKPNEIYSVLSYDC